MSLPVSDPSPEESRKKKPGKLIRGVLDTAVGVALYAMVTFVFINAVLRYVFNSGWPLSEELSRWLFVWVTFLGAIVAFIEEGHIGVDLILNVLGRGGKFVFSLIGRLLSCGVLGFAAYGAWKYFLRTAMVPAPASRLPQGVLTISLLIAMVSMLVMSVLKIIQMIRAFAKEKKEEK